MDRSDDRGVVGRHIVLGRVARGGDRSWRGYDPALRRDVVLREVARRRADHVGTPLGGHLVERAQRMGKLAHPNVEAVYDLQTERVAHEEVVFLVSEYVRGPSLAAWLAAEPRPWPEVLSRFLAAGRGLAAAHRRGVVHGSWSTEHVVLSPLDADAYRVKVVGFGLDVGNPDHDVAAFSRSLRAALVDDDGDLPLGLPTSVARALRRGTDPDPSRRFRSMGRLLRALQTHRRGRRWPRILGVSTVAALSVAVGWPRGDAGAPCRGAERHLDGIWDPQARAAVNDALTQAELPYADATWERTAANLDRYAQTWVRLHREACEATAVAQTQSPAVLDLRMACLERARTELRAVTKVLSESEPSGVAHAHELTGGLPDLGRCQDVEALSSDEPPEAPRYTASVTLARSVLADARAERRVGHYDRAARSLEAAELAIAEVDYDPIRIEVDHEAGLLLKDRGEYQAAESRFLSALERAREGGHLFAMQEAAAQLLYVVGYDQGRPADARRQYGVLALELPKRSVGTHAAALIHLGSVEVSSGEYALAESHHRRALEVLSADAQADAFDVAAAHNFLGLALYWQGAFVEAEREHRQALTRFEAVLPDNHPSLALIHNNIANDLAGRGQVHDAESVLRRALTIQEGALPEQHPHRAMVLGNLATVLEKSGNLPEAERHQREVLAILEATVGVDNYATIVAENNLATILSAAGRIEEAETISRGALSRFVALMGPEHPLAAKMRINVAAMSQRRGDLEAAELELRRAWDDLRVHHPQDPAGATAATRLASVLLSQGRGLEAVPLAEAAWQQRQSDERAELRARAALVLAQALWTTGRSSDRRRARAVIDRASAEPAASEVSDELARWRSEHRV